MALHTYYIYSGTLYPLVYLLADGTARYVDIGLYRIGGVERR